MAVRRLYTDDHRVNRVQFVEVVADRLWGDVRVVVVDAGECRFASSQVLFQCPVRQFVSIHRQMLSFNLQCALVGHFTAYTDA